MYARRLLTRGGFEVASGLVWFVFSVVGWANGESEPASLAVDALALVALFVAVFRPAAGVIAVGGVVLLGLLMDPLGIGMSHYIALSALIPAVRGGRLRIALAGTAVVGGTLLATMVRKAADADDVVAAVVVVPVLMLLPWLAGTTFRWIARAEADRVSRVYAERQLQMAADIHDFVSRNLTNVLARTESEPGLAETHPEFARALRARLRQSSDALHTVTQDLQLAREPRPMPADGAAEVLEAEAAALRAAGFAVDVSCRPAGALGDLPGDVDFVVGRGDGELALSIRNRAGRRGRRGHHQPLGLESMSRHASLAGGSVTSAKDGRQDWVCAAAFPLAVGEPAREAGR